MSTPEDRTRRMTRCELLKTAAAAAPGALLAGRLVGSPPAAQARASKRSPSAGAATLAGMNAILFLTDQERAIQHFPPGWSRRNLPGLTRLQRHGLTFDHGEMGLAHGGLRQKNFNVYEESQRVPLVYSSPRLFAAPRRSGALVSHVDLLPTLAGLFGAPATARAEWQGVDYSQKIFRPRSRAPQDYTVFTYDDWQSGQPHGPYPTPPNHVVSIRERHWKIARYYDADGHVPPQWELYDLQRDPLERRNLANPGTKLTREQQSEFKRLRGRLEHVERTRLQPLASTAG